MTERTSKLPRSERLPDGSAVVYCRGIAGRIAAIPCVNIFEAWRFEDRLIALRPEAAVEPEAMAEPDKVDAAASEPARQEPLSCPGCGDPLPMRRGRGRRIWCSPACRRKSARKQERDGRPPLLCPACSETLPPRPPGKGGHNQRYCNQACATWHKRHPDMSRPASRACLCCGTSISNKAITAKYCSSRCRDRYNGRVAAPRPTKICALPECALPFTPTQEWQRCCSEKHGKLLYNRESTADGRRQREPWNDARRERYHRRRALKKAASTGDPVRFSEIAERDHWSCGLCHKRVNPALAWPDPMSPSLDHVIPLTKGGMHDPANVQLAHLRCNVTKNNRGGGEQLALIG